MDWLTWQGIRDLATCEALTIGPYFKFAAPDPERPAIKWAHQAHLLKRVRPITPAPGAIVYTRAGWRAPHHRAQLTAPGTPPIVLVSAYCDSAIQAHATAEMFGPDSPVRHWFGVQAMTTHPRLTPMPLGVEPVNVPAIAAAERRTTRDILAYLNFQIRNPLRLALWTQFRGAPWVVADAWGKLSAAAYMAQLGRSRFVFSPPGCGWDCYRTYEAIAMGAIPIVQRKRPITDVCEALPVFLVDDWREVTPERLHREWDVRRSDTRTITLRYWRERIQEMAQRLM